MLSSTQPMNQEHIECESYQLDLIQALSKYRQENLFTDVSIFVDGVEFKCHKVILCASSLYFKTMFSCDLRESLLGKVYMKNLSPWTMRRLIDYIYSGKIEINLENCCDILNASLMFNLNYLVDRCCEYLVRNIDLYNCIDLYLYSECCMMINKSLHKATYDFILENFTYICESSEDFVRLNEECFSSLIASNLLNVADEFDVYLAILKWTQHDLKTRLSKAETLFSYLRFDSLSLTQLETILNENLVRKNSNLVSLFQTQVFFKHEPDKKPNHLFVRQSTIPRDYLCFLNKYHFTLYDITKQKWFDLNEFRSKLTLNGFAASIRQNELYLTGGLDVADQTSDFFIKFNFTTKEWKELKSMIHKRAFHSCLNLNQDFLFVSHGIAQNLAQVELIEFYDFNTDQWSNLTITNSLINHQMFTATNGLDLNDYLLLKKPCLALNNILYILNDNCLYCYEFDAYSKQLTSLPYFHLPDYLRNFSLLGVISIQLELNEDDASKHSAHKHNHFTWISLDEKVKHEAVIYFLGESKNLIYEFYPAKNKLKKLPILKLNHLNNQSHIFNVDLNRLCVVTKQQLNGDENCWAIEQYNSDTNEWCVLKQDKIPFANNNQQLDQNFPINNLFLTCKMSFK